MKSQRRLCLFSPSMLPLAFALSNRGGFLTLAWRLFNRLIFRPPCFCVRPSRGNKEIAHNAQLPRAVKTIPPTGIEENARLRARLPARRRHAAALSRFTRHYFNCEARKRQIYNSLRRGSGVAHTEWTRVSELTWPTAYFFSILFFYFIYFIFMFFRSRAHSSPRLCLHNTVSIYCLS